MLYNVKMLCKHCKGVNLLEKNIYEILEIGVDGKDVDSSVIYSGDNELLTATNLVVYKNIFQENKVFCREYEDISKELSSEDQAKYGQLHKVEPLTEEEILIVQSEEFISKKLEDVARKYKAPGN